MCAPARSADAGKSGVVDEVAAQMMSASDSIPRMRAWSSGESEVEAAPWMAMVG